jgi:hypothetical protein
MRETTVAGRRTAPYDAPRMLTELRVAGLLVAASIAALGVIRFRGGRASKTTLSVSLLVAFGLGLISIYPEIVLGIRDALGLGGTPLSGLVVALIGAVVVEFFLLLGQSARVDDTRRRLSRLVDGLARRSLELPPDLPKPGIAIILPSLNEAQNLDVLLHRIPKRIAGLDVAAVVVDDGSTDETADIVRRDGAVLISHPVNQGGGAALKLGYQVAWDLGAPIIVTMDADGQHDPAELERLVSPIVDGRADFVIGSRLKGEHEAASPIRHLGIYVFNALISLLARKRISDCSSGYRAFRASELRKLTLYEDQFHTSETILAAVKAGLRIEEVPVTISRRHSGVSKKPGAFRYGWGFFRAIWKTWWR